MRRVIAVAILAVFLVSIAYAGSVAPFATIFIRTLLDDENQAAAQTTLGLGTGNSPTFAGLTVTGNSVFGLNSSVFQPAADSTTFFQVKNAAGTSTILNVDTTNKRIGVFKTGPDFTLDIYSDTQAGLRLRGSSASAIFTDTTLGNTLHLWSGDTGYHFDLDETNSVANSEIDFRVDGTEIMRFKGGFVGVTETAPETLIELTNTIPYITLHNSTHEDTDGGRESRLNFKGEQSGGEETTLARIEVSHDGAADDEKGKIVFSTNDGADTDTPTTALIIDSGQHIFIPVIRSGATQAGAGAAANEVWKTAGHADLPDNVLMIGI